MSDLIDRQAAIDALRSVCRYTQMMDDIQTTDKTMRRLRLAENAIDKLPSAQPDAIWWPCKKRLPTTQERVVVSFDGGIGVAWLDYGGKWQSDKLSEDQIKTIKAWVPMFEN